MEVYVAQENLKRGLELVRGAASTSSTLPITENILFQTVLNGIRLTAYNLEVAVSIAVAGQVKSKGAITANAKTLWNTIGKWPERDTTLVDNGKGLAVISGDRKVVLESMPAVDFPPVAVVGGNGVTIDKEELIKGIHMTEWAAARGDNRPILQGCKMEIKDNKLTIVSSDGFRMAIKEVPVTVGNESNSIIPALTLKLISKVLTTKSNNIQNLQYVVDEEAKRIGFSSDVYMPALTELIIVGQSITGTYPNYRQLIPTNHTTIITMLRNDLLAVIKEMKFMANQGSGIVRFELEQEQIRLTTKAERVGEYEQKIGVTTEGGVTGKIAFTWKYVSDILETMTGDEVTLGFTTVSSPGLWWNPDDVSYQHVLMPMFVQW